MSTRLEAGSELAGYRVERVLGQGGMGVVYLAQDLRLERPVALKVVRAELAGDARFRHWFLQESQLAAGLDHPSIVPVYAAGEDGGVLYLAMRYVAGHSLRDVLRAERALAPDRTLRILGQVAAALDAAHAAGLVHRDVKPANVLLTGDPARRTEHAYLADFGLAKRPATADSATGSGALLGTIAYAAPEQIEGGEIDGRTDVYSLGCLLFECLTGRPPFAADSDLATVYAHLQHPPPRISTVGRGLPAALDAVIAKALAKRPDDRYRTARELVDAARGALPGSVGPRRSRRPLVAAAGLAVVGAAALGASAYVVNSRSPSARTRDVTVVQPTAGDALVALDARTGRVLRRIALPTGSDPNDLAVLGDTVYVANAGTGTISRIGVTTGAPVHPIHADGVLGLTTGDGTVRAVVRNATGQVLLRLIDGTSGQLTRTIPLPTAPDGWVALTRGWAWYPQSVGDAVAGLVRVSTDGSGRRETIPIGSNALIGPVVPRGDAVLALVASLPEGMQEGIVRADGRKRVTTVASMAHLGDPYAVGQESLAADANAIWSLAEDGTVWRVDPTGRGVAGSVKLGAGAWSTLAAGSSGVWAGDAASGEVVRIDALAGHAGPAVRVGGAPNAMWVDGRTLYVVTSPITAAARPATGAAARRTLRIVANGDEDTWDGSSYSASVWQIEAVTCNGLLDYRATSTEQDQADLVPAIAARLPTISADGRTYTFTIRRGLRFSDGSPVTPADVVDTYLRSLSPRAGFAASATGYFDDIAGARAYRRGRSSRIDGLRADRDHVSFRLDHADAAFPYKTAMRLVCVVPKGSPRAHTDIPPPMTGPFEIVSHTVDRSLVLVPNPVWPRNQKLIGEPSPRGVDRIEITFGLDPAAQVAAIAAGRADISYDDPRAPGTAEILHADPRLAGHVVTAPAGTLAYLQLNMRRGPFANRSLRLAANLAVDRRRIASAYAVAAPRPWSQYLPSTLAQPEAPPYSDVGDPVSARRTITRTSGHSRIPVSLWYFHPKPEITAIATEVAQELDAVGFRVTLHPVWGPFYVPAMNHPTVQIDMALFFWAEDFPDAVSVLPPLLGTGSRWNYGGYASKTADRRMARIARVPDGARRRVAWTRLADDLARGDAPMVVLSDWTTARVHSDRVHDVVVSAAKGGTDLSLIQLGT